MFFVLIPFDAKPDPLGGPDLDFDEIYAQDLNLELTASLLFGSLPGVHMGARLSSRANDVVIRPTLALVLVASGLQLLGVDNLQLGLWCSPWCCWRCRWWTLDATLHPEPAWADAQWAGGCMTVGVQLVGAPLGLGFVAALASCGLLRPWLVAAVHAAPTLAEPPAPTRLSRSDDCWACGVLPTLHGNCAIIDFP
jgi:hypothetical protein